MDMSGDYKCPVCGFIYAQYEHQNNETFYNCVVCGWVGWKEDGDYKPVTEEAPKPKTLQYAKVIGDVMTSLWNKDLWCAEAFQYDSDNEYLYDKVEKYGLGGVFVHLFNVNMS